MELDKYSVEELDAKELEEIEGGLPALAAILLGVAIGYVVYHFTH